MVAAEYSCRKGEGYKCKDKDRCLKPEAVCDGVNDCKNTNTGMDEHYCFTGNLLSILSLSGLLFEQQLD